jgi:hypothetical protein
MLAGLAPNDQPDLSSGGITQRHGGTAIGFQKSILCLSSFALRSRLLYP